MRVAWVFLKIYLNWLFELIGITIEFFYNMMYWIANLAYWLPYYFVKFSVLLFQWSIELTWDIVVWCWDTYWFFFWWTLNVLEMFFNVSILIPVFLTGK